MSHKIRLWPCVTESRVVFHQCVELVVVIARRWRGSSVPGKEVKFTPGDVSSRFFIYTPTYELHDVSHIGCDPILT